MNRAQPAETRRVLVLEGSHEEMGYRHGSLLREEIGTFLEDFLFRSEPVLGLPYSVIRAHAASLSAFIPPELEAEIRALAEGAGQRYLDVLSLNTFADTDALHHQKAVRCVNFVVMPPGSPSGRIYHARNFDFPHEGRHWRHTLLICRRPARHRQATLSLGWVGQAGVVTGLNRSGLMLTEVTSYPRRMRMQGTPGLLALRAALENAGDLEGCIALLKATQYMAGLNVLLSSGASGEAVSCELCADGVEVVLMRDGRLSISGVCQSPRLARGQHVPVSDVVRHLRTKQLLRELSPDFCLADVQEILRDRRDLWLDKQGRSYRCICNNHTIHSVVLDWQRRECWVATGKPPAPLNDYARLGLKEVFALAPGLHDRVEAVVAHDARLSPASI